MTDYQHVGVASDFSPTFTAVLAEAKSFARHCGADLEIVHVADFDSEKERRFLEAATRVRRYVPACRSLSSAAAVARLKLTA